MFYAIIKRNRRRVIQSAWRIMIIILYKEKYLSKTRFSFQEYNTRKRYEMIDSSAFRWMDNVLFDTNISPLVRGDRAPKAALPENRAIYIHSPSIMPAPADGKDKSLNAIRLSSPFPSAEWQIIFHYHRWWRGTITGKIWRTSAPRRGVEDLINQRSGRIRIWPSDNSLDSID